MKRYGLSAALLALIIISIGTYYVQASSGSGLPQYRLAKLSGDGKEAAHIQLEGYYGSGIISEPLNIGIQGSDYEANKGFLDQFSFRPSPWSHFNSVLAGHRQFLKGSHQPGGFYENDNLIAFAKTAYELTGNLSADFRIVISIWDKKTKEARSMEVPIAEPKGIKLQWLTIDEVQMSGNQFKIFTQTQLTAEGTGKTSQLVGVYTIDEADGSITSMEELADDAVESGYGHGINYQVVPTLDPLDASPFVVYQVHEMKNIQTGAGSNTSEQIGEKLMSYSLASGQFEPVVFSGDGDFQENSMSFTTAGNQLVRASGSSLGLHIAIYSLDDKKIASDKLITFKELGGQSIDRLILQQNKLYALIEISGKPGIAVVDWKSGAVLYQGAVSVEGTPEERELLLSRLTVINLIPSQ
ncbi:hypothetical protein ACFOLF_06465 [Paenibacillus sepulcri]|uniref:Uncharacterized protein n=1 Tax=Paenibacillus sepulcri TaxID=359917 RepID=A0ABS7BXJ6_9BACL|nr:hypothetical protein [Paenibacillus sepulcri]